MIPYLRQHSAKRIAQDPAYKEFLANQENIRKRLAGDATAPVDLNRNFSEDDLQMQEAIYVMRDMIYLHRQVKQSATPHLPLQKSA